MEDVYGRYEYTDAKSNKFWEVYRSESHSDGTCVATWGRIGTEGQSTYYPPGVAIQKAREKLAKGYVKVEGHDERLVGKEPRKRKPKVAEAPKSTFDFMAELKKVR